MKKVFPKSVLPSEEEQYDDALLLFFVNEELLQHPCAKTVAQIQNECDYKHFKRRKNSTLFVVLPAKDSGIASPEVKAALPDKWEVWIAR